MKKIILMLVSLIYFIAYAGCLQTETETYQDSEFLEWSTKAIDDMSYYTDKILEYIESEDYYDLAFWSERGYEKAIDYYGEVNKFKVSDKYKNVQYHTEKYLYYLSEAFYHLKKYAECMQERNYHDALDYLTDAKGYTELATNEIKIILALLEGGVSEVVVR